MVAIWTMCYTCDSFAHLVPDKSCKPGRKGFKSSLCYLCYFVLLAKFFTLHSWSPSILFLWVTSRFWPCLNSTCSVCLSPLIRPHSWTVTASSNPRLGLVSPSDATALPYILDLTVCGLLTLVSFFSESLWGSWIITLDYYFSESLSVFLWNQPLGNTS